MPTPTLVSRFLMIVVLKNEEPSTDRRHIAGRVDKMTAGIRNQVSSYRNCDGFVVVNQQTFEDADDLTSKD